MQHPDRLIRRARRLWHGGRLLPRLWRLAGARRQKRAAPPPAPRAPGPYRRFYTRDRSFAQLVPRRPKR